MFGSFKLDSGIVDLSSKVGSKFFFLDKDDVGCVILLFIKFIE